MSSNGKLYLIPNTLGPGASLNTISMAATDIINNTDVYITENGKEARKLLKMLGIKKPLQELTFFELNKHTDPNDIATFIEPVLRGKNTGVISDAGCPGIADPGAEIVRLAHRHNIPVVPLTGPSSITLGLMASGFNGQHFTFHGYLPIDQKSRIAAIKKLEKTADRLNQTQVFIETPYRNDLLIKDIINNAQPGTLFCVAANLTLPDETIISTSIEQWKKNKISFHKKPAVFLLYTGRNYQ